MADGQHAATLDNGLRVSFVERPHGKRFSAAMAIRTGSHDDPHDAIGAAHLAEHLAFLRNNRAIAAELSEQHAWVNGWTAADHTMFQVSGHVDHADRALELLAGILSNQELEATEFERERSVLVSELIDAEPGSLGKRNEAISCYRRRVSSDPHWRISHQERVKAAAALRYERVTKFRRRYRPQNAVLAITGTMPWESLVETLNSRFEIGKSSEYVSPSSSTERGQIPLPSYDLSFDSMRSVWLQIDFRSEATDQITRTAAGLLAHRLGGGPHSEMWRRFRDNSGDAYHAYAGSNTDLASTQIGSYLSTDRRKWDDALRYLLRSWNTLERDGFQAEELRAMKQRLEQWWDVRLEYADELTQGIAIEMLRAAEDRHADLREKFELLRSIDQDRLNEAIRSLLNPENRSLFVGGCMARWAGWKIRRALSEIESQPPR